MFGKKSVETLVVGAGPCGMLAALMLADGGNDVTIVDAAPRSCTSSNSAVLHPLTLKMLDRLGIAERLIKTGYRIDSYAFFDGISLRQTFDLRELPVAFPYALSVPQSELEMCLEQELEDAGVRILWDHRVSDYRETEDGLEVTVDRYAERGTGYAIAHEERVIVKSLRFRAKNLIAADGYNSMLRRIAGIEQKELGESQYFVTFEFDSDRDPTHRTLLSIKDGLATAQQPINTGLARLQFQFNGVTLPSRNREKDRSYMQLEEELPDFLDQRHFEELVKERVPWRTGYMGRLRYRAAIPFEKRYLEQPYQGNVFFLGDSARSFAPLGSLGLNLGLQEAEQLAHALLIFEDEPLKSREALAQLSEHMVGNWLQLADLESATSPTDKTDSWLAKNRGRVLRSLPATDDTLRRLAQQVAMDMDAAKLDHVLV
ncbi:FAD-dependent oxidoreductase [Pelagicoccus albus]|uniref:FAD-dependent monooxygenase n=1 Tax=Pelagicoccus albus TaxID=415222 RepID=A0A7X1B4U0_9BACT|nr:NAD(P)/FAD-dependent oxidoreductase [Pelagicoccus albus]MBC2605684.1 FAD-dependent monooxygenase [Pelagicoccus albus]